MSRLTRRALLAATGAAGMVGAASTTGSADCDDSRRFECIDDERSDEKTHDEKKHDDPCKQRDPPKTIEPKKLVSKDGTVCTQPCAWDAHCDDDVWYDGMMIVSNCATEYAETHRRDHSVFLVAAEKISPEPDLDEYELEDLDGTVEVNLRAGEWTVLYFTGGIRRLDRTSGDLNIAISQRDGMREY